MTKPSDDECIALAMLHGCEFEYDGELGLWYAAKGGARMDHPIHRKNKSYTGFYGFKFKWHLAIAYCEYFKLIGDEDEHSPQLRPGHAA